MPPDAALTIFGSRLDIAERYADLLANDGIRRGLIGPREVDRLWERHILNCAVIETLIDTGEQIADVGSGAGLPGIPVAIARPDVAVVLIEPLLRRVTFLEDVVTALALNNVSIVRSRAEDMDGSARFDVVTARAVAAMERLARWTLPLVRDGGRLLAIKGVSAGQELADASRVLRSQGAEGWDVVAVGDGVIEPATQVAVVRK